MALVFKADRAAGEAATHVMIVGVDHYPWLDRVFHGTKSLSSCCNSATAFYHWMTDRFRNERAPLGTVRLLLSPDLEHPIQRESPGLIIPATRETFFQEAIAWAEDLSRHRDSIGIFLFSGHGFGAGFDRRVLALSDAGQSEFAPFQGCVSFDNIYAGLAPNEGRPDMARQQYFFLDCGADNTSVPNFLERNASQIFALPSFTRMDDREAVTYSAAAPGGLALARADGVTLFISALIRSLEGSGAQPPNASSGYETNDWVVTASSLANGLNFESQQLRAEHELTVQFPMSGVGLSNSDSVLHELPEPPQVRVRIYLRQRDEPDLLIALKDPLGGEDLHFALEANAKGIPQEIIVPAGFYHVEARSGNEVVGKPALMLARPPFVMLEL